MKKFLRHTIRVLACIIALSLLLWAILLAYMLFNKAAIITKVKAQINKQIKGEVVIEELKADFIRTFPFVSVRLTNVSIRDSLWNQHHHDFLKAEKIYVRLKLLSLFSGKPGAGKLIIENASVYLYTDTSGYTNLVRADDPATNKDNPAIPDLLFKKVRFTLENKPMNKFHDIDVERLQCDVDEIDSSDLLNIKIKSQVHSLAFNTQIGSYLKAKSLEGNLKVTITADKTLEFNNVVLRINKHPFTFNAKFFIGHNPKHFTLSIQTRKINYKTVAGLLTKTIQQKFDSFNVIQPFDIRADIRGHLAYKSIPRVNLNAGIKNADIESPLGRFNDCSFSAQFTNEVKPGQPRMDENSAFILKNFAGKWEQIPLTSDAIEITNLKEPFLVCDLRSVFALEDLNELTGSNTIQFMKGLGNLDIRYKGSLKSNDTIAPVMDGNIRLSDADIKYIPRNFVLKDCEGNLEFQRHDLLIQQLKATAGTTKLNMNGSVRNFLALVNISPEQLTLEWNISTPNLNINDFLSYIGKKSLGIVKRSAKSKLIKTAENIDRMLKNGIANLHIKAGKVLFKKFNASDLSASVLLFENKMVLNNATLNHAGGSMELSGSLTEGNRTNTLFVNSTLNNIDIPKIFYSFSNFGQDAITDKNMRGRLTAQVNLNAALTDKAQIVENSIKGTIDFSVKNGELINFEPVKKIAETAFKKRDFSEMRFAELKNKLTIDGSAIRINKMEIRSNVINLFVEGVYDTKKGTDMSIQVPASNIISDDSKNLVNKGRAGLNIRLRAKTGEDGKLKVSWDPFNKASKDRREPNKTDSLSKLRDEAHFP